MNNSLQVSVLNFLVLAFEKFYSERSRYRWLDAIGLLLTLTFHDQINYPKTHVCIAGATFLKLALPDGVIHSLQKFFGLQAGLEEEPVTYKWYGVVQSVLSIITGAPRGIQFYYYFWLGAKRAPWYIDVAFVSMEVITITWFFVFETKGVGKTLMNLARE